MTRNRHAFEQRWIRTASALILSRPFNIYDDTTSKGIIKVTTGFGTSYVYLLHSSTFVLKCLCHALGDHAFTKKVQSVLEVLGFSLPRFESLCCLKFFMFQFPRIGFFVRFRPGSFSTFMHRRGFNSRNCALETPKANQLIIITNQYWRQHNKHPAHFGWYQWLHMSKKENG